MGVFVFSVCQIVCSLLVSTYDLKSKVVIVQHGNLQQGVLAFSGSATSSFLLLEEIVLFGQLKGKCLCDQYLIVSYSLDFVEGKNNCYIAYCPQAGFPM